MYFIINQTIDFTPTCIRHSGNTALSNEIGDFSGNRV